ncbi:hypothetical protein [Streptomyces sp. NPDC018833]|uniref:hypothetical protein n=1 Tax=Streptomyces sp. NPDC018833 TaxID=3365053 RepID=UPI0037B9ED9C
MADLYELQLALDLPDSLPDDDLRLLRWHLDEQGDATADAAGHAASYPLLSSRGPASRVGGTLVGALCRRPEGWALTARQELHPDEFDDFEQFLKWLVARTTTIGTIGYLRFYESHVPDILVSDAEGVSRKTLRATPAAEQHLLPNGCD